MTARKIGILLLFLVIVSAGFFFRELRRGRQASAGCRQVTTGMSLAQALELMGPTYRAHPGKGGTMIVFDAPFFAETVPVVHVDPAGKVVRAECP